MSAVRALVAACTSKACAPPPVGTGGSAPAGGSRRSTSVTAALKESREQWKALRETDPKAADALLDYMGDGFEAYNSILRGTATEYQRKVGTGPLVDLQRAFDKASVLLPSEATLYRGMGVELDMAKLGTYDAAVRAIESQFAVGTEFTEKGFTSTSTSVTTANKFSVKGMMASKRRFPTRVIIKAPKGTRVLAGQPMEQEVVLAPNTKYRVVDAQMKNVSTKGEGRIEMFVMTVEVVP